MLRVAANRFAALACIVAIGAILASNLWCESACIADQSGVSATDPATCHEARAASIAISSHHDCRDHQIESLTATATPRVDLWQATAPPIPVVASDLQGPGALCAARTAACPSPPARSVAVLRI